MKKIHEVIDYYVGGHYLPAIINYDWTGLEEEEANLLDEWYENLEKPGYFEVPHSAESEFRVCDISGLYNDCYNLRLFVLV